jgi:hypothetical protein
MIQALQGFARACRCRLSRRFSFLRLAACCTVLRSRWWQSGVRSPWITRRWFLLKQPRDHCSITLFTEALGRRVVRRSHSPGPTLMSIPYLEAAPIGGQLFIVGSFPSDCTAFPLFLDTYTTRQLAEALSRRPSSKAVGAHPAKEWGVHLSRSTLPLVSPGRTVLPHAILKTHN